MKKLIDYLKKERYSLIFEVIVVIIGMLLALSVDGIIDDKKEQKKLTETFIKNKKDIFDSYISIHNKIREDTTNISSLLDYTKEIDQKILSFGSGEIYDIEFKKCGECVLYVLTEVDFHIDLKEFRKISLLPLYTLNSAIFKDIEYTKENDSLITAITDANTMIDQYYYFVEGYLTDNMRDIERDIAHNVEYFKENVPQYFYLDPTANLDDFDVTSPYYLNMLRARMDYMSQYTENLNLLLEGSKEVLSSIVLALSVLESEMEL